MKNSPSFSTACLLVIFCLSLPTRRIHAQAPATQDISVVKNLDSPRTFPKISSPEEWQARAKQIREHILVCCGLWPMPEKTPLNAHVFGKIERDGYTVECVYLQPSPGFYLGGNLYRPLGKGKGPFPGILNPHGHWSNGRMADNKDGSIAARCISFARQGMIAFSYDMTGYNDTFFPDHGNVSPESFYLRHRRFATNQANLLWNISLMGLQTWNSIRAVDFLESLPDVDSKRLACTGESGGGTQTFMLGAVEDRLAAQAPVVMVSHSMQGGCLCENAPGLRVEYSNMEIAAVPSPRPQILVAASGDWTKDTLTIEGPSIAHIYQLLNAPEHLRYVRFDFDHNYNQTSREAVYQWFGKWLLHDPDPASLKEAPYKKEPDADLRVWPDGNLPADALTERQFIDSMIKRHQAAFDRLMPRNKKGLEHLQQTMLPVWQHTLQATWPDNEAHVLWKAQHHGDACIAANLEIKRAEAGAPVTVAYFAPPISASQSAAAKRIVVLARADGTSAYCDDSGAPRGLAKSLIDAGDAVLVIKNFSTPPPGDQFTNFFSTYNRTQVQERVQDLLTVCSQARTLAGKPGHPRVVLCGSGRAGLWALLAAPAADAVIADADQIDPSNDQAMLAPDLFCPGIRNLGAFEGVAMLAAPHPLLVQNTGNSFPTERLHSTYKAVGEAKKFKTAPTALNDDALLKWVRQL